MNRRDLFKRAGKLGLGLGLGAVVGKGVMPDDLVARQAPRPVTEALGSSVPASTVRQAPGLLTITEHKYRAFEVATFTDAGQNPKQISVNRGRVTSVTYDGLPLHFGDDA